MTYIKKFRLKDRELEHKLNEISDGDFSASLNDDALYLSKYLSRVNKHIWRDKWGILKTYVTA